MVQEKRFVRGANNDYGSLRERNASLMARSSHSLRLFAPRTERVSVTNTDTFLRSPLRTCFDGSGKRLFAERTTTMARSANGTPLSWPVHPIVAVRSANGTCVCHEHRHVPASPVRTCLMIQESVSFAERTTTMARPANGTPLSWPVHPIVAVRSANGTCVCHEHRHVPASAVWTCLMIQEIRFVRGANNDYGSLRERNASLMARSSHSRCSLRERTCVCHEHRHVPASARTDMLDDSGKTFRSRSEQRLWLAPRTERMSVTNTDTFLRVPYGHARWFRKSVSFAERTTTMAGTRR